MVDTLIEHDRLYLNALTIIDPLVASNRVPSIKVKLNDPFTFIYKKKLYNEKWAYNELERVGKLAREHVLDEVQSSHERSKAIRNDIPNKEKGNYKVIQMVSQITKLVEEEIRKNNKKSENSRSMRKYYKRMHGIMTSYMIRSGPALTERMKKKSNEIFSSIKHLALCFYYIDMLYKMKTAADYHSSQVRKFLKMYKLSPELYKKDYPNIRVDERINNMNMLRIGDNYVLRINKKTCVITSIHFKRITNLIKTFVNHTIASHFVESRISGFEFYKELVSLYRMISKIDVERIGAGLKGLKSVLVATLDKEELMNSNQSIMLLREYDPIRRQIISSVKPIIFNLLPDIYSRINFLNIYKSSPHPDQNLYECFNTVYGTKTPYRTESIDKLRFQGAIRKNIFSSLARMNYQVRTYVPEPEEEDKQTDSEDNGLDLYDPDKGFNLKPAKMDKPKVQSAYLPGTKLCENLNASSKSPYSAERHDVSEWAGVKFQPIRNLMNINTYEIEASNKASQGTVEYTGEDLKKAVKYMIDRKTDSSPILESKTINDAVSSLKGESKLDAKQAIDRFKEVVRLHEEFESKYPDTEIDDIPSKDLEDFLMSNPKARYLVGTEPKFGEVHKPITRMFYMAEQQLKAITQRVERFVKLITRSQSGVSITKGYAGRKLDIEEFSRMAAQKKENYKNVFISFDMNEFSKRFPMDLVRMYGGILSEITGEKWLSRIDLFFRASIVIHNTRNHFDYIAGIRGGFEGFLNFVWSSIHATIMEISLECVGKEGRILTFSDDGLLALVFPKNVSNTEIISKISGIKDIYEKHGLHFKLSKTLVSSSTWEYLGEVCHEGKILESWMKEVGTVGKKNTGIGLESFYGKIKAFEGQSDSILNAGGPVMLGYVLKRLYAGHALDRLIKTHDMRLEEALLCIPASLGGFRITSPYEMMNKTSHSIDSEIIADIELIGNFDPELARSIKYGIFILTKKRKFHMGAVISGSIFSARGLDTSGMSMMTKAVKIANETLKHKIALNPLDDGTFKELEELLRHCSNINLRTIGNLIISSETWTDYCSSISLLQTNAIRRFIPFREIRKLQKSDTINCLESTEAWYEIITDQVGRNVKMKDLISRSIKNNLENLKLETVRPSPRIALSRSFENDENEAFRVLLPRVTFRAKTFQSVDYLEPRVNFAREYTTLSWYNEKTSDKTVNHFRNFLDNVARFLAYSPEASSIIKAVCRLFKFDVPVVPLSRYRSIQRRKSNRASAIDVFITINKACLSLSEVKRSRNVQTFIDFSSRVDITSYSEAVRAFSSQDWTLRMLEKTKERDPMIIYRYKMDPNLYRNAFQNKEILVEEGYRPYEKEKMKPIPERFAADFIKTHEEYLYTYYRAEAYAEELAKEGSLDLEKRYFTNRCSIDLFSDYLRNQMQYISKSANETHFPPMIPYDRKLVITISIINTALTLMNPQSRRRMMDDIFAQEIYVTRDREDVNKVEKTIDTTSIHWKDYFSKIEEIVLIVENLEIEGILIGEFNHLLELSNRHSEFLLTNFRASSLFGRETKIIFSSASSQVSMMSPRHQVAIKAAFTTTISELMVNFRALNWNRNKIMEKFGLTTNCDEILDILHAGRDAIRASTHRSIKAPFNKTTLLINLRKIYILADKVKRSLVGETMEYERKNNFRQITKNKKKELLEGLLEMYNRDFRLTDFIDIIEWSKEKEKERLTSSGGYYTQDMFENAHTDHLKVVKQACTKGMLVRVRHLINFREREYNYVKEIIKHPKVENELKILSRFYKIIYHPVACRIQTKPLIIRNLITQGKFITPRSSVDYYNVNSIKEGIFASQVNLRSLSPGERQSIFNCIRKHARSISDRLGFSGYKITNSSIIQREDLHGGKVSTKGPKLEYFSKGYRNITEGMKKRMRDSDFLSVALRTKYSDEAMATYTYLNHDRDTDITLFKNVDDNYYYIIGIVSSKNFDPIIKEDHPMVTITYENTNLLPEDVIPSIRLFTENPFKIVIMPDFSPHARKDIPSSLSLSTIRSKYVQGKTYTNENSTILQAAYDIVKSHGKLDPGKMLSVYVAIKCWSKNKDLSTAKSLTKLLIYYSEILSKVSKMEIHKVYTDVSLACAWLKGLDISRGFKVRIADERELVNAMNSVEVSVPIPSMNVPLLSLSPGIVKDLIRDRKLGETFNDYSMFKHRTSDHRRLLSISNKSLNKIEITDEEREEFSKIFF